MKKFRLTAMALFLIVVLAAGCGGGGTPATNPNTQATAIPTLSASQPTATELPPTATPQPTATATTAAAAPGNLPQDLANSVNKTRDALKLRFEISYKSTTTTNGKQVTADLSFKAEGNGTDEHFSISGTSANLPQALNYETIKAGGQLYEKGVAFGKADPNTWYVFPAALGSALSQPTQNPKGLLAGLKADDFKPGNFQATGIEIVDLNPCQVWTAQTPGPLTHFLTARPNTDQEREFKAIDKYEGRLWTCLDGYLHQGKLHLEGHDPAKPADKATFDLTMHIYDFNAAITISPPANAQPFPTK